MDTKFTSKYSDVEQGRCVQLYLEGHNKAELAKKYGVSIRTIERWIKIYKDVNYIDIRMSKRNKAIPIHIQKEVMEILNRNAIIYGFNISIWDKNMIVNLLQQKYDIKITRYMAKLLLEDKEYFNTADKDRVSKEIIELEELDYKLVILDFFRIGRINKSIIEPLAFKKFNQNTLNVNLGIARLDKKVYVEIIFTDRSILKLFPSSNNKKTESNKKENLERKNAIDSKVKFIKKISMHEKNKIVFISMKDGVLRNFNRKNSEFSFYITDKNSHNQLGQDKYEREQTIVQHICDENNEYRNFDSITEIISFVENKLKKYKVQTYIEVDIFK